MFKNFLNVVYCYCSKKSLNVQLLLLMLRFCLFIVQTVFNELKTTNIPPQITPCPSQYTDCTVHTTTKTSLHSRFSLVKRISASVSAFADLRLSVKLMPTLEKRRSTVADVRLAKPKPLLFCYCSSPIDLLLFNRNR